MKKNYNINHTLNSNLCIGCGVCQGACPSSAIALIAKNGRFIPEINGKLCRSNKGCHRCYDSCPGLGVDLHRISVEQFNNKDIKEDFIVGRFLKCFTGYSNDFDIRYHCASGGMVSSFLIFLLEKKYIDGAVVTAFDPNNELLVRSYIAYNREDVLNAKSSKYAPVSLHNIAQDIKNDKGKRFIIVGLPCHIHGFRKLEGSDRLFREKIVGYFAIFCSSGRTFYLTEYLLKRYQIEKKDLTSFSYRDEGCLGSMIAKGICSNTKVPFRIAEQYQKYYHPLRSFFIPRRCLFCIDHYGELGDVCFGDIHIAPFIEDKVGVNSLIVRKQQFLDWLIEAKESGCVTIDEINVELLKSSQKMAFIKKKRNVGFIALNKVLGRVMPTYDVLLTNEVRIVNVLDYIQNRMQQCIGSHKSLWWLVSILKKNTSNYE